MKVKSCEEIKIGSTILTEEPFVYVLKSSLRTENCDNCLQSGQLLKCSGCQYVYYCNRVCQKDSWPIHKYECKNLRKIFPKILPDAARMIARIIFKLKNGGDQVKGYYSENKFRMFKDLMSHYSDLKNDEKRINHFMSLCGVLFEYLGETSLPNSAELMGIYGRLCINGFNILNSEMISIGTGIYLGTSIVDHSCDPNAVAVFEGTTIHIRTLKPIKTPIDWSQIFISYIDVLNTPTERQDELKMAYYFLCICERCIKENEDGSINSCCCPNQKCSGFIEINTSNQSHNYSCSSCNTQLSKEFVDNYIDVFDFTHMHLQNMKQHSISYLDVAKVCLKKQHGLFYNLNLMHVKMLESAFESSIEIGQWEDAKSYGHQLIPGYRKYYGQNHPLLGILYLKLGKILVYENNSKEALPILCMARDILHVTHGIGHTLCKTSLAPLLHQASVETSI